MITSTQNPKIQRIRDLLAHSRSRSEQKAFVIEGIRLVEEAVLVRGDTREYLLQQPVKSTGNGADRKNAGSRHSN